MGETKINKDNLKWHARLIDNGLTLFRDDSVYIDTDVDFPAYSGLKAANSFAADLRSDTSAGTMQEVGNINYLISIMDAVDSGAVTEAKALGEEE